MCACVFVCERTLTWLLIWSVAVPLRPHSNCYISNRCTSKFIFLWSLVNEAGDNKGGQLDSWRNIGLDNSCDCRRYFRDYYTLTHHYHDPKCFHCIKRLDTKQFWNSGKVLSHAQKHIKVFISTHVLPNSGPLLCVPLEFSKALLQSAYFCFCSVLLQSSKAPPCLAPQPLPPPTFCLILLHYVMVNMGGGDWAETEISCFYQDCLLTMTVRITVSGSNWTLEKVTEGHQWN